MTTKTESVHEPTMVNVKLKRKPRFKAGAELSSAVNFIHVDILEETTEISSSCTIKVQWKEEVMDPKTDENGKAE